MDNKIKNIVISKSETSRKIYSRWLNTGHEPPYMKQNTTNSSYIKHGENQLSESVTTDVHDLRPLKIDDARCLDVAEVGGKAAGLCRLTLAGQPVPRAYVLPVQYHRAYINSGGIVPEDVLQQVLMLIEDLGGHVALRSSANVEDADGTTAAGIFSTYFIKGDASRKKIARVLQRMYQHATSSEVNDSIALYDTTEDSVKLAIVVQKLVIDPQFAGVAYTTNNGSIMVAQYARGYGSNIASDRCIGSTVVVNMTDNAIMRSVNYDNNPMPKLVVNELCDFARAAVRMSPGIERDLEFAYDNDGKLWMLQDRPLTSSTNVRFNDPTTPYEYVRATREYAIYLANTEMEELGTSDYVISKANFSELMPKPTPMDIGTFRYIFTGNKDKKGAIQLGREILGYEPGTKSSSLYFIGGAAYESLARDALTYNIGIPGSLEGYIASYVESYLHEVRIDESKAQYPEFGLYCQNPTLDMLTDKFGSEQGNRLYEKYEAFTKRVDQVSDVFADEYASRQSSHSLLIQSWRKADLKNQSNRELLNAYWQVMEHMRNESCINFVIAARLGFYYTNYLGHLLATIIPDKDEVYSLVSQVSSGLYSSVTEINDKICSAASLDEAIEIAREDIWHYPVDGEVLELRHERMCNREDKLRDYVHGVRCSGDYSTKVAKQRIASEEAEARILRLAPEPLKDHIHRTITKSKVYMALRETTKNHFTKEYALLRDRLSELQSRVGLANNDIFYVYPEELEGVAERAVSYTHLITARRNDFELSKEIKMPTVLVADTIDEIGLQVDGMSRFTSATGAVIAPGDIAVGIAVNVVDFSDNLKGVIDYIEAVKSEGKKVILVAQQVNLTLDPVINIADGLIIANAGLASHGAQRARELGTGALSGICIDNIKTGMKLRFDPESRMVTSVE